MLEAINSLFVSEAWAMAPPSGEGGGGSPLAGFLPLIIIFVIFYFLLIRPQQKRAKEHKEMLAAVKKGDKVVTSGGIYGLVEDVGQNTVTLKIAENVRVKFGKSYIASLRSTADES
ncbi:MAG: preprotein translocase subunit YajC [Nitrospirota bacterium]|jgi:preprotein translocase subunit YajC